MPSIENNRFPDDLTKEILDLLPRYPEKEAALIPALHLVQDRFGHVSDTSIDVLGDLLDIAPAEILGTLTFYTMFRREPEGRFHVNVCKNLSCTLMGSRSLLTHLEERLGISIGETTEDGLFTLGAVECLGACTEAPVMEVDGEYHMRLTPEKADAVLDLYRKRAGGGQDEAVE